MLNPYNGSKSIVQKICQNLLYKSFRVALCQKTAQKKTRYWTNETILEIGHHAKAIAHAKTVQRVKINNPKNMSKSILQII